VIPSEAQRSHSCHFDRSNAEHCAVEKSAHRKKLTGHPYSKPKTKYACPERNRREESIKNSIAKRCVAISSSNSKLNTQNSKLNMPVCRLLKPPVAGLKALAS